MFGLMKHCAGIVETRLCLVRRWTAAAGMGLRIAFAETRPPSPTETADLRQMRSFSTTNNKSWPHSGVRSSQTGTQAALFRGGTACLLEGKGLEKASQGRRCPKHGRNNQNRNNNNNHNNSNHTHSPHPTSSSSTSVYSSAYSSPSAPSTPPPSRRSTRCHQTGRVSPLTLAAWNVRFLLDNPRSNRPERRTALGVRELARYKVDIAALSETRFSEQGQLEEVGAG
ncbi:hypothetical protein SprV_0401532500 [Sparganum proliferum]